MVIAAGHLTTLKTLTVGLAGGAAFAYFNLPVPWLAGAMFAVATMAMADIPVDMPLKLRDAGFLFGSVSLGATVTPDALQTIARYPLSLIGLTVTIFATVFFCGRTLERFYGWDRPTAFLASVPGALSMVMALASSSSGDVRRIAIVQAVRLFALVIGLPMAINATMVVAPPVNHTMVSPAGMMVLFLVAFTVATVMERRIPNPMFLAGMVSSTLLHVSGLIPGELPQPVTVAGMLLVGIFAGVRFAGTTVRMLVSYMGPALIVLAVGLVISAGMSFLIHKLTGLNLAVVLVAFAPGGAEAMIMMGAAMGLDTLYVSTHHVLRTVGLNAVTPFFAPKRPDAD